MCNSFKNLRTWKMHCLRIVFLAPNFYSVPVPFTISTAFEMSTYIQRKFTHYEVWLLSTKSEKGLDADMCWTRVQCRSHQWTWCILHKRELQKTLWDNFGYKRPELRVLSEYQWYASFAVWSSLFFTYGQWSNYRPDIHTRSSFAIYSLNFVVFSHLYLLLFLSIVVINDSDILTFISLLRKC